MLHKSDNEIGWINRKFANLERQIRENAAARRLEAATIGAGGLHVRGGDIFLEDADGAIVWKASADPLKTSIANGAEDGLAIPVTWTELGWVQVDAPAGYSGQSTFLMNVAVGDSMSAGTGNVVVQPLFRWRFTDGSTSATFGGHQIASAESEIVVASSFWAAPFTMNPAYLSGHESKTISHVEFGVKGVLSFGAETGVDGNWHLSATVNFKRRTS